MMGQLVLNRQDDRFALGQLWQGRRAVQESNGPEEVDEEGPAHYPPSHMCEGHDRSERCQDRQALDAAHSYDPALVSPVAVVPSKGLFNSIVA